MESKVLAIFGQKKQTSVHFENKEMEKIENTLSSSEKFVKKACFVALLKIYILSHTIPYNPIM